MEIEKIKKANELLRHIEELERLKEIITENNKGEFPIEEKIKYDEDYFEPSGTEVKVVKYGNLGVYEKAHYDRGGRWDSGNTNLRSRGMEVIGIKNWMMVEQMVNITVLSMVESGLQKRKQELESL